jgi:hypothetical protein
MYLKYYLPETESIFYLFYNIFKTLLSNDNNTNIQLIQTSGQLLNFTTIFNYLVDKMYS